MICPNCGYTNQPNNRFCVRCGIDTAALQTSDTPASASPSPSTPPPPGPPADPGTGAAPAPPIPWGAPPPSSGTGPPPYAGQPPPPPYANQPPPPPYAGQPPPPPYASQASPPGPPNPFAPPATAGPPGYPQLGYGQYPPPYPPSGAWAPTSTNGFAIAALVLGLVGWMACGVGSVLAIVFGFAAQSQIRDSQGRQGGGGMARAGIILGFVGIALLVLFVVIGALTGSTSGQN